MTGIEALLAAGLWVLAPGRVCSQACSGLPIYFQTEEACMAARSRSIETSGLRNGPGSEWSARLLICINTRTGEIAAGDGR